MITMTEKGEEEKTTKKPAPLVARVTSQHHLSMRQPSFAIVNNHYHCHQRYLRTIQGIWTELQLLFLTSRVWETINTNIWKTYQKQTNTPYGKYLILYCIQHNDQASGIWWMRKSWEFHVYKEKLSSYCSGKSLEKLSSPGLTGN